MRRRFKLINTIVILVIFLLLIGLAVVVFGRMDETVEGFGIVQPRRRENIRARVDGVIREVFVDAGDQVLPGDTLVTIHADDLLLAAERSKRVLEQTRTDLLQLEEEYQNLMLSKSFETQSAFANLYQARQRAEITKNKYERAQALYEQRLISVEERDERKLDYEVAESYLQSLEDRAGLLEKRYTLQIQKQEEQLRLAQSEQNLAVSKLEGLHVISPLAGQVMTSKTDELVGQRVSVGQVLMEIGDASELEFVATVSESDIAHVEPGQRARVAMSAFPEHKYKLFEGAVTTVSTTPEITEGGVFFEVTIRLEDPWVEVASERLTLRPGFSGTAEIVLHEDVRIIELILGIRWD